MKNLVQLAGEIQQFILSRRWKFCFIGGLAVQHWGEPRLTRDIDLSLYTGFGQEDGFVATLLEAYEARIPDARVFASSNRVVLLRSSEGIGIDVSLAALPFEESLIERAVDVEMMPGLALRICSAEDLIILKAFASRPMDWRDVETIVARQETQNLNWSLIEHELSPLVELKGEPEIVVRLARLKAGG